MIGKQWEVGKEKGHGCSFLRPYKLQDLLLDTHSYLPPKIPMFLFRGFQQKSHCFSEVLPGRIHCTGSGKLNLPTRLV